MSEIPSLASEEFPGGTNALREVRERLWNALRLTTAAPPPSPPYSLKSSPPALVAESPAEGEPDAAAQPREETTTDDAPEADVPCTEEALPPPPLPPPVATAAVPATPANAISAAVMEQLISSVFCAIHSNATAADAAAAAKSVLPGDSTTSPSPDAVSVPTAYISPGSPCREAEVDAFLDAIPARWMPDLAAAQNATPGPDSPYQLWVDFNAELVDCVVSDVEPHVLLKPDEVLTVQACVLVPAALSDYVEVLPARPYPAVYDTLFAKLNLSDDHAVESLSLDQFRLFFHWFKGMHFSNTNQPRTGAAAEQLYYRYLDAHGAMTVTQFQLACEEVCGVYAKRRDTARYLQQLVHCTEAAMSHVPEVEREGEKKGTSAIEAAFFLHPEKVTLPAWRRPLPDPEQLYLPDELRVIQQEAEIFHRHSGPRILLIGPAAVGKTRIGLELARTLHCVHLDVLDLALAAMHAHQHTELGEQVTNCLATRSPLSISLQVALLQAAALSERALYRGYVFSDTIATAAGTLDAVQEQFVRPLQLQEKARPDYVVELACADAAVYAEYATGQAAAVADVTAAVMGSGSSLTDQHRSATEKAQMKADCAKILIHLTELEEGEEVAPEELGVARQQAAEAQEILDALEAEEKEEENGTEKDDAEEEWVLSPEERTNQAANEDRMRLATLIYEGRRNAALLPAAGQVVTLDAQDWSSLWRKSGDSAKLLGRHLQVDAIASGDAASVVSYAISSLQLHPCHETQVLRLPSDREGDQTLPSVSEPGQLSTLAEEEQRGRAVTALAEEQGLTLSLVWKRFCPVTAALEGVLVDGAACYACVYRGSYYCFTCVEHRDAFADNPTRYLRVPCPERKAVLLLADGDLAEEAASVLRDVVDGLAVELRLAPYNVSSYAGRFERRRDVLQARAAALEARQRTNEATRRARQERRQQQQQATQAAAEGIKGAKGKLEPTKPAGKKNNTAGRSGAAAPQAQRKGSTSSVQGRGSSGGPTMIGGGGRRRVPRAMVVEGPKSIVEEKALLIEQAKRRLQTEAAPVLLTATTPADLEMRHFENLQSQRLIPETVVVLHSARLARRVSTGEAAATEQEEAEDATESATSPLQAVVQMLERNSVELRSSTSMGDDAAAINTSTFRVHHVYFSPVPVATEAMAEVLQLLDPLSAVAAEDAVDEALGVEVDTGDVEAEAEDLAAELEEEDALLYPDGTTPLVRAPEAPRDSRARPARRFLHQFGSCLDYCPVTLQERRTLVRGRPEWCLRYVDGLYIFASEEARDAFARCPQRYAGNLPPQDVPPRVWLLGVTQSGKKTLVAALQESFGVPHFVYDRRFFEECVAAAMSPRGGLVHGVMVPPDSVEHNPFLRRAHKLLEEVWQREEVMARMLREREAAEKFVEERERRAEEGEDEDGDGWTDEQEAALQEKLEFEPEDEEEKQVRLSEAYLRIASCVTRLQPFEQRGYVMICPPFSDGDLDVLFDEGSIPEVVVRLNVDAEVFNERTAALNASLLAASQSPNEVEANGGFLPSFHGYDKRVVEPAGRAARGEANSPSTAPALLHLSPVQMRQRTKALARWRRRHIGAEDDEEDSDEGNGGGNGRYGEENGTYVGGTAAAARPPGAAAPSNTGVGGVVRSLPPPPRVALTDPAEVEADRIAQEDALDEFVGFMEERLVEVVKISAAAARETVRRAVIEALGRHLRHRASLFYVPEVLKLEVAEARLNEGRYDLSSFGRQDPVWLYEYRQEGRRSACTWKPPGIRVVPESANVDSAEEKPEAEEEGENGLEEEPEELSEVMSDDVEELRALVERREQRTKRAAAMRVARVHHRVYFFRDDASLLRFVQNPWPFMRQSPPLPALLEAPVVSVFEPDTRHATETNGEKQRCLGDSVAYNLASKCVSASSLLAWGAAHSNWHALRVQCLLAAQQSLVDTGLLHRLLALYLSAAEAKQQGAVLHNLPLTISSADALSQLPCAAPIAKVMTALAGEKIDEDWRATVNSVVAFMKDYASVTMPLPYPHVPLDSSNLVAAVHGVEAYRMCSRDVVLRVARAFPVALKDAHVIFRHVQRHLSEFGVFCPHEWSLNGELVRTVNPVPSAGRTSINMNRAARFLGQYFFFSSDEHLESFLADPTMLTETSAAKPIPVAVPMPISPEDAARLTEEDLALEGCCPVLLYDTREKRDLHGNIQPTAKKGSLKFVIEYEGMTYAMLNAESKDRFLRNPKQYVEGAALPSVLHRPQSKQLQAAAMVSDVAVGAVSAASLGIGAFAIGANDGAGVNGTDTDGNGAGESGGLSASGQASSDFVHRHLYEPVAQALLAVARERPLYPGLSPEESALKFVALYLKANRDPSTVSEFEAATYERNFEAYQRRATLYQQVSPALVRKQLKAVGGVAAPVKDDAAADAAFCAVYDESHADPSDVQILNQLVVVTRDV